MAIDDIDAGHMKVDWFAQVYGRMHTGIEPHAMHLDAETIGLLDDADFVFVCVDSVAARAFIIPALEDRELPYVDCGLGLSLIDERLMGLVRVTTSTPAMRKHVRAGDRIPMTGDADDELYRSNIQVADLNMLAGTLAVIQYKQLRGFYLDTGAEYHAVYSTDGNTIINADRA